MSFDDVYEKSENRAAEYTDGLLGVKCFVVLHRA